MPKLNLLAATRVMEKSMPFVLYRLLMYLAISLAYVVATLAGAGTLVGVSSLTANPSAFAQFGAMVGFAGCGFFLYKTRFAWWYTVKVRHLALLAAAARGEVLPKGLAQIDYARRELAEWFPDVSSLRKALEPIRAALRDLPALRWRETFSRIQNRRLRTLIEKSVGLLVQPNDQIVIAYPLQHRDQNLWRPTVKALLTQTQYLAALFKMRLWLMLFEYLGLIAAFVLLSIPFKNIAASLPTSIGLWDTVFALVFAWAIKAVFFEPIANTALLDAFGKLAEGQDDPQIEAELREQCGPFRALWERANH